MKESDGHMPAPASFSQTAWFRAGLALAVLGFLPLLWSTVCVAASGVPWNPARLAPSFALAYGLPIYALRDSGQHLGWFYGPGLPVWNLPAALSSNSTHALLIAAGWNAVTSLLPFALILRAAEVARGWRALAGALLMGMLLLGNAVTNYGFYFIHVDALCLAASLVACVAVHRAATRGIDGWLHVAGLALAVAFWTKQISFLLGLAMLVWLWREGHRRQFWRLMLLGPSWTALLSVIVFWYFGTEEVLFNCWLIHSRNPWRGGIGLMGTELARLGAAFWAWVPVACVVLWLHRIQRTPKMPAAAAALVRLLLWAAAIQLPLGLTALLKAGGGLNSLHSLHYLLGALLVSGFHILTHPLPVRRQSWLLPGLAWLVAVVVPLGCAVNIARRTGLQWKVEYNHERLVQMARAQPGRYYFPWNPLATLIADRRVQPLDDALYCLWLARLEPPVAKIRAAVPADPIILYEEPAQSRFALRYFSHEPVATRPAAP